MTLYFRNGNIEAAPMQGEAILFDPGSRKFCVLNGTAAALWERLETPATIPDLAADLRRKFNAPNSANVESDVRAVMQNLVALALVTSDNAT